MPDPVNGIEVLGLCLLLSIVVFVPLRHLIDRAKLRIPYTVMAMAVSAYVVLVNSGPARQHQDGDRFAFWFNRVLAGAIVFVLVRVVDRLVLIPFLSRGGTSEAPRHIHQLSLTVISLLAVLMYGKYAFGWPINDFLQVGAVLAIVVGLIRAQPISTSRYTSNLPVAIRPVSTTVGHQVFVSHSSRDKLIADAIVAHLERNGLRCWVAPRDILPGANWATSILRAIAETKVMVLVFSSETNESQHIRREVERAVHHGIPIAPIRINDVLPDDDLEYFLSSSHWMDAINPPFEQYLHQLAEKLQKLLDVASVKPNRASFDQ